QTARSCGVVSTLTVWRAPSRTTNASVNVPPVSMLMVVVRICSSGRLAGRVDGATGARHGGGPALAAAGLWDSSIPPPKRVRPWPARVPGPGTAISTSARPRARRLAENLCAQNVGEHEGVLELDASLRNRVAEKLLGAPDAVVDGVLVHMQLVRRAHVAAPVA